MTSWDATGNSCGARAARQVKRDMCASISGHATEQSADGRICCGHKSAHKCAQMPKRTGKKLVNDNVPKSSRWRRAKLAQTCHCCQNQRSPIAYLERADKVVNLINQTLRPIATTNTRLTSCRRHQHEKNESTTRRNNNNKHRLCELITSTHNVIKYYSTIKIAIIYIVFTSLTSSQQNFRSSATQHHQAAATTNFYWPTSIMNHQFDFQQQQQQQPQQQRLHHPQAGSNDRDVLQSKRKVGLSVRSIANAANRRSLSSSAAAAAAATAAAIATANAALARRGQSRNLMIGQNFNNFSSAVPYSVMMQDVDYLSSQEDPIVNEPVAHQSVPIRLAPPDQAVIDFQHDHQASNEYSADVVMLGMSMNSTGTNQHLTINSLPVDSSVSGFVQDHFSISSSDDAPAVETSGSESARRGSPKIVSDRALLPLDSNRLVLPQMQQIKARFNQGCVGGTKCQFFAFCWMSGGSLGASCGLLMTCCVTPSRQEIQPGFYGPVVNDPYCGRSTNKINRIVGGTDASFGQFPWQAFVQVGGSRCGGALISSRHVVTAGHCVARSQHSPSSIKVTLGDYILNSDIESIPHEVFSVIEVLLHPNFRFTPQADRYDVAVLELDRVASYKDNIKPICLPQKDATFVGRVAYVAGWGALQAGSKLRPKVLQHVAVPVIENHVCESWHRRKGIDIRIYDEMMCAGYELGQRDACQGDSGGPLMLNQFGVWYLVGIVSAGYSCAKQYQPGIYHRVSSSSDWISSNVYQQGSSK